MILFYLVITIDKLRALVSWWIGELTLNPLGFSPLLFEPSSGHMWESLRMVRWVFFHVLRFSPTFDERSARYIPERAVKPKSIYIHTSVTPRKAKRSKTYGRCFDSFRRTLANIRKLYLELCLRTTKMAVLANKINVCLFV